MTIPIHKIVPDGKGGYLTVHIPSPEPVLAICGVSGSGKSVLEANLVSEYPEIFHKLHQLTTRPPRGNERQGEPYTFVTDVGFDALKDRLVGVIGTKEDSLFKKKYGSIPDFVETKISTVILAEEGIYDLFDKIKGSRPIFILGLDVQRHQLDHEAQSHRPDRDEKFMNAERAVLSLAHKTWANGNGRYMQPVDVVNWLIEQGAIKVAENMERKQVVTDKETYDALR
jgi:guanylate kinase